MKSLLPIAFVSAMLNASRPSPRLRWQSRRAAMAEPRSSVAVNARLAAGASLVIVIAKGFLVEMIAIPAMLVGTMATSTAMSRHAR